MPSEPTIASPVSPEALQRWLGGRRWFAQSVATTGPVEVHRSSLPTDPPVEVAVVDPGGDDRYQLLVTDDDPGGRPDVADDRDVADGLARWIASAKPTHRGPLGPAGQVVAHWLPGATDIGQAPTRALRGEQSNTSMVVGGTHVLKVLRRLHPGPHPEIEIGRHLAAVAEEGFTAPVAALSGWYELDPSRPGTDTTEDPSDPSPVIALGVVQELVPGALDAWAMVLSGLAGDAGALLGPLRALGTALAHLHTALAEPGPSTTAGSPPQKATDTAGPTTDDVSFDDVAFGVGPLARSRVTAMVDAIADRADHLFASTFDRPDEVASLAGRSTEIATLATTLAGDVADDLGAAIRHHGDLHLGQVVLGDDGWVILDFEGEPARSLRERRQRHSPLRDVAGMLRSFAYAAATHQRSLGRELDDGWEAAARAAFLDGYLAAVDPALLPGRASATQRLLHLFELEKVLYEIDYELAHRPDWVGLPVNGLRHLLDGSTP